MYSLQDDFRRCSECFFQFVNLDCRAQLIEDESSLLFIALGQKRSELFEIRVSHEESFSAGQRG